jgi:hypothetical protein
VPSRGQRPIQYVVCHRSSHRQARALSAVRRGLGDVPELTGHVRITGRSDSELVAARRQLERTAQGVKVELVRLDREQVPGLLATLPLGGAR